MSKYGVKYASSAFARQGIGARGQQGIPQDGRRADNRPYNSRTDEETRTLSCSVSAKSGAAWGGG